MTNDELMLKSLQYRKKTLNLIKKANTGHTGGDLSSTDILSVLYNRILNVSPENFQDSNRDRFIMSKGHSVEVLYTVLADCGFFPETDLNSVGKYQSPFVGHPTRDIPGIEQNTGALGHGLSIATGMAIAGKKDKAPYKVFTLLGDGEMAEGSNWEAFMLAAHYKLDNLIAIVDRNQLQITGHTEEVCSLEPLKDKIMSFGWAVKSIDGHNVSELIDALQDLPFQTDKPSFIIANTIKGKGVSFMENNKKWHHGVPSDEQFELAIAELDKQINDLNAMSVN
ncbi:transketolase [bacterium]|nr:transketolase [bacterium]